MARWETVYWVILIITDCQIHAMAIHKFSIIGMDSGVQSRPAQFVFFCPSCGGPLIVDGHQGAGSDTPSFVMTRSMTMPPKQSLTQTPDR
jgi:hypothetical protein